MESRQLEPPPYEWIVNSNALGVGFLAKAANFHISFLSRHAVRRLDKLGLLGRSSGDLLGKPATHLAESELLSTQQLSRPENYPASFRAVAQDRHVEFAISPVFDEADEYLGVMVTFKDISEQAGREQQALDFQERMGSLVAEARERGNDAETAAAELDNSLSTVRANGDEINRLLEQLTLLNSQTALLSLNANIEASRASDAEAFGVIASEMRDLAASMDLVAGEVKTVADSITAVSASAEVSSAAVTNSVSLVVGAQQVMEEEIRNTV